MIAVVAQTSGQSLSVLQEATRSGLELVPRLVREAGSPAVESYLCFFASLRSKHTGYVYRAATKHFFRWAEEGGLSLADLRAGHVESFFADTPWKQSTISFYFHSLKKLFAHLESDRVIKRSPFAALPTPKNPKRKATNEALKELKAFLIELDGYGESSSLYRPGLVAMFPVVVGGQDTSEIARITGLPLDEVESYAARLRDNGIWKDGRVMVSFEINDPKPDPAEPVVEMVLIIGCAAGIFAKFPGPECEAA